MRRPYPLKGRCRTCGEVFDVKSFIEDGTLHIENQHQHPAVDFGSQEDFDGSAIYIDVNGERVVEERVCLEERCE